MFYDPKNVSVPYVLDNHNDKRVWDLWSRLNNDRLIFLGEPIGDVVANIVVAQLLYLESQNKEEDIYVYINSPGGSISSGLAIYDTMKYIKPDVQTICVGLAASMGAVLLSAGTKGKRFCLPNSDIMIHQPLISGGGLSGQATDILIHAKHLEKTKQRMVEILAENTGQTYEKVYEDCERDNYMTAEEAREYGLVDEVIYKRE